MKAVCSLLLLQWLHAKSWILLLVGFFVVATLARYLVPWEIDPTLVPAAKSQVIYGFIFIVGAFLLPTVYAEAGRSQISRNHRLFWRAQGLADVTYFCAVCLMCFIAAGLVTTVGAGLIAILGPVELSSVSLFQSMVLTLLAMIVCAPIAIGISQWVNSAPSAIFVIIFNLIGYYGPANVNAARSVTGISPTESLAWEIVYGILPQLRLGDQSERITFCWAPIPWSDFLTATAYLGGWVLLSMCFGYAFWRRRS